MTRIFIVPCLTGLLLLSSCTPAPPPAPPDTRAADERALRDTETAWNKEWVAKDLEPMLSHYAEDASLLVPGMPIATGKEAIRAVYKQLLTDPNVTLSFSAVQVEISKSGDLAYTRGT